MSYKDINEVTDRHLHILWTNSDPITAVNMVLMYATNSLLNDWWDKVTVIIWGATQKLATENETVRFEMQNARDVGVEFSACASCASNLGTKCILRTKFLNCRSLRGRISTRKTIRFIN